MDIRASNIERFELEEESSAEKVAEEGSQLRTRQWKKRKQRETIETEKEHI